MAYGLYYPFKYSKQMILQSSVSFLISEYSRKSHFLKLGMIILKTSAFFCGGTRIQLSKVKNTALHEFWRIYTHS